MGKLVYFVVRDGDVIFASEDEDEVDGFLEKTLHESLCYEADEQGLDIEDLDEDELAELRVATGESIYSGSVIIPEEYEMGETFSTPEGDEIEYFDVENALEREIDYEDDDYSEDDEDYDEDDEDYNEDDD